VTELKKIHSYVVFERNLHARGRNSTAPEPAEAVGTPAEKKEEGGDLNGGTNSFEKFKSFEIQQISEPHTQYRKRVR